MPTFQFDKFTTNNIIKSLLNNIPVTVGSYNFVIIGNTLIFPLGDTLSESYSVMTDKKDITSGVPSATFSQVQDGSTILTQRIGNQLKVSSRISFEKFNNLFGLTNDASTQSNFLISFTGLVDFALDFAYDNFDDTDCILITRSGIKGAGSKRLKLKNFNRTYDSNQNQSILIDMLFNYEDPIPEVPPAAYEVDEDAINNIIT